MIDKIMLLFKSVAHTLDSSKPASQNDHLVNYILSPRNQRYLRQDVHLEYRQVECYEHVSQRQWRSAMNFNFDDDYHWLRDDPVLFERLFYLDFTGLTELVVLTSKVDSLIDRACELSVGIKKVEYYDWAGRTSPLYALAFKSPKQFRNLFWPDNIKELIDTIHIGLRGKASCIENVLIERDFDLLHDPVSESWLRNVLPDALSNFEWLYTLKIDLHSYDVGDPAYSIWQSNTNEFENWIRQTAQLAGYELYELPLLGSLIWNWVAFGEIPIAGAFD